MQVARLNKALEVEPTVKFRSFLLKFRLWGRLVVSKRHTKRLLRQIDNLKLEHERKIDELRRFYEKRLTVERLKVESLHLAWSDRLLQSQKLLTVSHITHDLDEKADNQLEPVPQKPYDPEKDLSGDQMDFYLDAKDGFWEAELEMGRSESEIAHLWNTRFKPLEIARAKASII